MTTLAVIIIMFIVGFVALGSAQKIKRKLNQHVKPIEKTAAKPKVIGHALKWPIKSGRKAAEESLKAGKKVRDKTPI